MTYFDDERLGGCSGALAASESMEEELEYIDINSLSCNDSSAFIFEGGLNGFDDCADEDIESLAWMATGYFLLALPIADPDQGIDLVEGTCNKDLSGKAFVLIGIIIVTIRYLEISWAQYIATQCSRC